MKIEIVKVIFIILSFSMMTCIAFAQEESWILKDTEGCNDHPFITKMPGYVIITCNEITSPGTVLLDLNRSDGMPIGDFKVTDVGTRKSEFEYHYLSILEESHQPNHNKVLEHYEKTSLNTAQKIYLFDKPTFHGSSSTGAVYKTRKNNRTYWVVIMLGADHSADYNKKNDSHLIKIIEINNEEQ